MEELQLDILDADDGSMAGLDLLMNDKKKATFSRSGSISINDVDKLESELRGEQTPMRGLFGGGGEEVHLNFDDLGGGSSGGADAAPATSSVLGSQTWDGFNKLNDSVLNTPAPAAPAQNLSGRDKNKKKKMMLRRINEWKRANKYGAGEGVNLSLDSPFEDIEDEYDTIMEENSRKASIDMQIWWFKGLITTLEWANTHWNPFDIDLDGWAMHVEEDMDSYENIFGEIYEKYKGGKISPELNLVLKLGSSAATVCMMNSMMKQLKFPVQQALNGNPELARQVQQATLQTMAQNGGNPMMNMMNDMMNPRGAGPPPPMAPNTPVPPNVRHPQQFEANLGSRPDLRGPPPPMFEEAGVEVGGRGAPAFQERTPLAAQRRELRGPTQMPPSMDELLTRTINMNIQGGGAAGEATDEEGGGGGSMISAASAKELANTNMPKKIRRRRGGSSGPENSVSISL